VRISNASPFFLSLPSSIHPAHFCSPIMAPQPELLQRSTVHEMNMIVYKDIYRPCSNKKHLSTEQQKELVRWKKAAEYYFSLALPLIGVPCGDYEAGAEAATGEYYFPLSELSTVRGCLEHLKRQVAEGKITDPDQLVSLQSLSFPRNAGRLTSPVVDSPSSVLRLMTIINPCSLRSPTVSSLYVWSILLCCSSVALRCVA